MIPPLHRLLATALALALGGLCDFLAELARRYFTSHGPATLPDFVWWSGLSTRDARQGLEANKLHFEHETVDGETYWFVATIMPSTRGNLKAYLLPNYDEYTVGYTDRSAGFDAAHREKLNPRDSSLLGYLLVIGGRITQERIDQSYFRIMRMKSRLA